jgi:hypothetical protein
LPFSSPVSHEREYATFELTDFERICFVPIGGDLNANCDFHPNPPADMAAGILGALRRNPKVFNALIGSRYALLRQDWAGVSFLAVYACAPRDGSPCNID